VNREERLHFKDLFRGARARALLDSEGFEHVVQALEQIGAILAPGKRGLFSKGPAIVSSADQSPLASRIPHVWSVYHTELARLYDQLRVARNDAVHEGAVARHLTNHAVLIAIVIEDSLMNDWTGSGTIWCGCRCVPICGIA
jgi:hypothetical protein